MDDATIPTPSRPSRPAKGSPWPVFATTLRGLLLARKTPVLLAVLLIPSLITLILFPFLSDGQYDTLDGSGPVTTENAGRLWFQDSTVLLHLGLIIPLVAAFYATGLIGDEVANKTLPYVFTRPVRRAWILLAKFSAFFVGTSVLVTVAVVLHFFLALSATQNPWRSLDGLLVALGVVLLALFAMGSLFLLMGVGVRFPLVFAIIYFLLWENIFGGFPAQIKRFTLLFYERSILMEHAGRTDFIDEVLGLKVSTGVAVTVLLVAGTLFLAAACLVVSRKDYNV